MDLDARTVFVMGAGFLAITTITLSLLIRTLPADIRSSAVHGTAATFTLGVSWLLFALEDVLPDVATVFGANLLYLLALTFVYQSLRLLDGARVDWRLYVLLVLPAVAANVAARYVVDSYEARVVIMSVALAIVLTLSTARLFREPQKMFPNPGRRAAAFWLATTGALLLVRVALTAFSGRAEPILSTSGVASLGLALSVIVALGAVFSYFLLFSGRITAELAVQARLDPLTDLLNRRAFEDRAQLEIRRAARNGVPVSLLMVDANDFKSINDTWGHQAGDQALQAIADGIRAKVRPYDLVARLGGDEFAVLLPGLGSAGVADLVPRLLASIADQPTEYPGQLHVSIGSASLEPGAGGDEGSAPTSELEALRRLVRAADQELYGAKQAR